MVDNVSADELAPPDPVHAAAMVALASIAELTRRRIPDPGRATLPPAEYSAIGVAALDLVGDPGQMSPADYRASIATAIDFVTHMGGFTGEEGQRGKGLAAMVAAGLPALDLHERITDARAFGEAMVTTVAELVVGVYTDRPAVGDYPRWLARRSAQLDAVGEFVSGEFVSSNGVFADTGLDRAVWATTKNAVADARLTGQPVRAPGYAAVAAAAMLEVLDRGVLDTLRTRRFRTHTGEIDTVAPHVGAQLLAGIAQLNVEVVTTYPGLLVAVDDLARHLARGSHDPSALDRLDALRARIPEIFDDLDSPDACRVTDALDVARLDPGRFCTADFASVLADPARYVWSANGWINHCRTWMTEGPAHGEDPTAWQGKALVWRDTITAAIENLHLTSEGQVDPDRANTAAGRLHQNCATWIQVGLDTTDPAATTQHQAVAADLAEDATVIASAITPDTAPLTDTVVPQDTRAGHTEPSPLTPTSQAAAAL